MAVIVKRFGGPMRMDPVEKRFELDGLDAETRDTVRNLINSGQPQRSGKRVPDDFVYSFEDTETKASVKFSGMEVPAALSKLLP